MSFSRKSRARFDGACFRDRPFQHIFRAFLFDDLYVRRVVSGRPASLLAAGRSLHFADDVDHRPDARLPEREFLRATRLRVRLRFDNFLRAARMGAAQLAETNGRLIFIQKEKL